MSANDTNPFSDANDANEPNAANELARQLEQLKADHAALQSELHKGADNSDVSESDVQKAFTPHVPQAITNIILLAEAGESESVRLSASKYIVEMASKKLDHDSDAFKELMQRFSKKDKAKEST